MNLIRKIIMIEVLTIFLLVSNAGAATISSCGTTISTPGTYLLNADILDSAVNPCILITASDVTIDGNGHFIDGKDTGTAIYSYNPQTALSHVNIRNMKLTDWAYGVYYRATIDSELTNNNISSSTYGFYFNDYSGRNKFIGNNLSTNSYAFYIQTGYNNFTNNKLYTNSNGFYLYDSDYNVFNDNIGDGNSNMFYLNYVENSSLNRNTAINKNGLYLYGTGFYLSSSNNNTLKGNRAVQSYGFYLASSNLNTLENNNASDSNYGFYLSSSRNNTLKGGNANSKQFGIYLSYSNDNIIRSFTIRDVPTYYYGMRLDASNNNRIYDNIFNNINNVILYSGSKNIWNINKQNATNIVNGMYTAGNSWENPSKIGLSQICSDMDRNGICDTANPLDVDNVDNSPLVHHIDSTIPKSVSSLINTTYNYNSIKWTWTDPSDIDFSYVKVYIDGIFRTGVLNGVRSYNATGFLPNTNHIIGIRTVDVNGNENATIRTHTARTKTDAIPPGTVTNLKNTTYLTTSITWTWKDATDYDLQYIKVYIDGTFKANIPKGVQMYVATGFTNGTSHTISTRAQDTSNNLGVWMNKTANTKP